jgi:hypothetical protein
MAEDSTRGAKTLSEIAKEKFWKVIDTNQTIDIMGA